jgi:hypothetical protein
MKTKLLLPAILLALACARAFAAESPAADPAAPAATEAKEPAKKKMIEKGMNTDEITKLFGQPKEIKPMESPDPATKVEQWIYRRKLKEVATQEATGQHMVPTFGGINPGGQPIMVDVPQIEYRPKIVVIYQVTALLMVNGRLEIAKQWTEQEDTHQ